MHNKINDIHLANKVNFYFMPSLNTIYFVLELANRVAFQMSFWKYICRLDDNQFENKIF